uniref:Uncharacterized protein n=1 Tax=Tetranychus urticae TaxID=32264 RepID=T1JZE0_TETUR
MQPIPVFILFSLFIASSVVCNEQSPDFDLQSNVHGRHFLDTFKITSNVVSSVASNAGKGIGGVDAETKLGNAVISGINGVRKLADAGSNGDAEAVESFANMTGDAVRSIGDIAAYNGNMASGAIKGAGRMANLLLSELGLAPLGSFVKDGTNQLGDVASDIGSAVDEEFDALGAVVGGEEIGNKINTSMAVQAVKQLGDAVSSGIDGAGKLASAGSNVAAGAVESFTNMTGDAVRAIGDIAAFQANMVTSVAQSLLGAKLGSAIGQGTNGLGNDSVKSAGAKGDSLSDEASIADQIVENAVKAAIGPAMKVSDNVDATFVAITYGASKAGEMASNGLKAASDAAGEAVGALTGAFSGLFG